MQLPLPNLEDLDRSKITVDLAFIDKTVFKTVDSIFVYLRNIGAKDPMFNYTCASLNERRALLLGYMHSRITYRIPCLIEEEQNILSYAIDGKPLTAFNIFDESEVRGMLWQIGSDIGDCVLYLRSLIAYMLKVVGIGVANDDISEEHGQRNDSWHSKNLVFALESQELVMKLAKMDVQPQCYEKMFNKDIEQFIRAERLLDGFINMCFAVRAQELERLAKLQEQMTSQITATPEL